MISNNDILNCTKTGLYASKTIIHDIYNKTYSVKTFSYKNEFEKGVDVENLGGGKGHPVFPLDSILNEDENKISDFSDALLTVQSTDRTSFVAPNSVYPNYNNSQTKINPEENTLNRFHKFSMLNNGLGHFLEIVGNTALEVGDIVTLKFPKNQKDAGEFSDEKLSEILLPLSSKDREYMAETASSLVLEANKFSVYEDNLYYAALSEVTSQITKLNLAAALEVALVEEYRKVAAVPTAFSSNQSPDIRFLHLINHARYEILNALLHRSSER